MIRVSYNPLNGRLAASQERCGSYYVAESHKNSNFWSCSENNATNSWNVNFQNGNVNNNNNKYNSNVVWAVSAFTGYPVPQSFIDSVWEAYHDCLRGKMRSAQAVEYMTKASVDIPVLASEIWEGTYKPGTSTCFLVKYPKLREVFAASFRDRIVHHWIALRLTPLFEKRFESQGNVSFNCRKGFGTDKAVTHVAEGMRSISNNYRRPAWVFRGDLEGFFMSINKDLLWHLLERFIKRKYNGEYKNLLLYLVREVVMHHPEKDCIINSPPEWWSELNPRKSLFTMETGLPIGNLTTQLFANFLMSHFISYVHWLFRGKNYCVAQFVDDFILVSDDLKFLKESIFKIEKFLKDKLGLTMHKEKRYLQPVSHGVLFVGTYIKPGRLYLSDRTIRRMKKRFQDIDRLMKKEDMSPADCRYAECVMNSYLGFCRRRRTYRKRRKAIDKMGMGFWEKMYIVGPYEIVKLKKKYKLNL